MWSCLRVAGQGGHCPRHPQPLCVLPSSLASLACTQPGQMELWLIQPSRHFVSIHFQKPRVVLMTASLGWSLLLQSTVLDTLSQTGSPWAMLFKWVRCSLHRVVGRAWCQPAGGGQPGSGAAASRHCLLQERTFSKHPQGVAPKHCPFTMSKPRPKSLSNSS